MPLQNIARPEFAISSPFVNPPSGAFDGGENTWATASVNYQAGVDYIGQVFPDPQTIQEIRIKHWLAGTALTSVIVQTQDDGGAWASRQTSALVKNAEWQTIATPGLGTHKGVRLLANADVGNNDRWQIAEIEMMAEAAAGASSIGAVAFQAYTGPRAIPLAPNAAVDGQDYGIGMTVVPHDQTYYAYGCAFDPVTHEFVAQAAGLYHFGAYVQILGQITGRVHAEITVNNNPDGGFYRPVWPAGNGLFGFDIDIPLAVGDRVSHRAQVEAGSGVVIDGPRSVFFGHLVR